MDAPRFYVHVKNRQIFNSLYWLKDTEGKKALSEHNKRILEYIGSFDPEKGCFAGNSTINQKTCQTSPKTFKRNLDYLIEIGAISISGYSNTRKLRLNNVEEDVIPQKVFRYKNGVSSYLYLNKNFNKETRKMNLPQQTSIQEALFGQENDLFFDDLLEKSSTQGEKSPEKKEKCSTQKVLFSHILTITPDVEKERKETPPPKVPLLSKEKDIDFNDILKNKESNFSIKNIIIKDFIVQRDDKQQSPFAQVETIQPSQPLGVCLQDKQSSFGVKFSEEKEKQQQIPNEEIHKSEQLLKIKKKNKDPKNLKERIEQANELSSKGHLINPLGKTNNKGRKLIPHRASSIGELGEITTAQLYAYLTNKFNESGWEDVFQQELAPYRETAEMQFSNLQQKFIDLCGHKPTFRELYEYFKWLLEDKKQLDILLSTSNKNGKGYPSWFQMMGSVYIRNFYDKVLLKKIKGESLAPKTDLTSMKLKFVEEAYNEMICAEESEERTISAIRSYSIILYAQFLSDRRSMEPKNIKQKIIDTFVKFINNHQNKERAINLFNKAYDLTHENVELNNKCLVFEEWKETLEDIKKSILEQTK